MLDRAKALFTKKRAAVPAAEPFALRCICGRKIEGLRRVDPQTLNCEHCGAAVFVLPINSLPLPGLAKRSKSIRAQRSAPIAPTMEPVPDEALDASIPMPADGERAPRERPAILDRRWLDDEPDEEEVVRRSGPIITRKQLIVLGIALFVALGGYGIYYRLVSKELTDNLPDRARRGLQLVQEGKLDEAYEPLRLAWKAIQWAGAPYPKADEIYQTYQEVAAVKELLPEPLEDALEASLPNPSSFAARYRGKAVLIDVEVEKNPEGGWFLYWALPIGEKVTRLHPGGIKLFDDLDITTKTRVLMAARVQGVQKSDDGLYLVLQPNSGVLVTELAVLQKMGLGGDTAADALRKAQRERVISE